MTYTRKAVRGAMYVFVNTIIASLIAYVTRMALARNMAPDEFGLFFSVWTFVAFFLFFTDLGLAQALAKFIAEFKASEDLHKVKTSIVSTTIFLFVNSAVLGLALYASSNFLADNYFKNPYAADLLKLFFIYVLARAVVIAMRNTFMGLQKMFTYSLFESVKNIATLIIIFVLFQLGYGIFTPMYAYIGGWIVLIIIFAIPFIKSFPLKHKIQNLTGMTKKLFLFGIPLVFTGIGERVVGYISTIMLTYFATLTEVGIYNVVFPSALIFMFFSNSIGTIALPMTSELWAKKDKKRISDGLGLFYKYAFLITIPFIFAIFIFAKMFITLFFGEAYATGALAFQILLIGVLFFIVAQINNSVLAGIGKPREITKNIIVAALTNIVLNLILIPNYGMNGAAISTAASYVIVLVLSTLKIRKFVGIHVPWQNWVKTFGLGLIFALAVYFTSDFIVANKWLELVLSVGVGLVIYAAFVLIFKMVDFKEIKKYILLVK